MKPTVNWDDLRYFLAVHRRGSHKAAARLLRVAPTTVGRRISALEGELRTPLFVRTPERLQATPAGLALLPRAERVEAEVQASERELQAEQATLAGPLRVTGGDALINHVVVPSMGQLFAAHPELVIEVRTETALVDLSRREADVALRLVRPKEPSLVARPLGALPFAIFASEAYLQRRGTPRTFAAAAAHDFIGYEAALDQMSQVRWLRRMIPSPRFVLRATTTTTQVIACAEGLGLALLPVFSAAREPRLRQLFPRQPGPTRELWGVFHADLRRSSRIAAFLGWLSQVLEGHVTR
ncbi:MAG TPA: LysR family transcriptional regulator [Polyangia bacterium]